MHHIFISCDWVSQVGGRKTPCPSLMPFGCRARCAQEIDAKRTEYEHSSASHPWISHRDRHIESLASNNLDDTVSKENTTGEKYTARGRRDKETGMLLMHVPSFPCASSPSFPFSPSTDHPMHPSVSVSARTRTRPENDDEPQRRVPFPPSSLPWLPF